MSNKIEVDTKTFVRFWLVILGLGLIALFIMQAATGLLILGIALFLAIAISPLVNKLADVIPGKGRRLPTALAYVLVMAVLSWRTSSARTSSVGAMFVFSSRSISSRTVRYLASTVSCRSSETNPISWP